MEKVFVPPIKIQGIKTKMLPIIKKHAMYKEDMLWIEPFMGSGVVGFNMRPRRALFADTNPHIINFYNGLKNKEFTSESIRAFLETEGALLAKNDDKHYLLVRKRFNDEHSPLDFLFLNRCCFNGMIRFNKKHEFNTPYNHKPLRFSKAYVTKIVNQVRYVENCLSECDWQFVCQSFETTLESANDTTFVYADPPYIGRHVDFYDSWSEEQEIALKDALFSCGSLFMLSTWDGNEYRKNEYIDKVWGFCNKVTQKHFYFIGAMEKNRKPMMEALLTNYVTEDDDED